MMNPNNNGNNNNPESIRDRCSNDNNITICCHDNNIITTATSLDSELFDSSTGSQSDMMIPMNISMNPSNEQCLMLLNSNNGSSQQQRRQNLVHSVSIIVEPAINVDEKDDFDDDNLRIAPPISTERRKTIAGPISVLEDLYYDQPKKAKEYDDVVQSLFASARLRKEEFARLLEEHDQIVKEINKAETKI